MNHWWWTLIAVLVLVALLSGHAAAATISGTTVDWFTLEPLPKTVVTINTTPEQSVVAQDANYSFQVPPGDYLITAEFYQDNVLLSSTEKDITIEEEGDFVVDLILFPFVEEDEDEANSSDFPLERALPPAPGNGLRNVLIAILFVLVIAVATIGWYVLKLRNRPPAKEVRIVRKIERVVETRPLPADLNELFEFISQQKRLTQKELRQHFPQYSEAKISLMLSDLEDRGLIRRIKKGRGKIIRLAD